MCHFVLCFSVLLVLRLPRLGKGELILVLFVRYVCSICACLDLSVSSSSWGLGRAVVCDCGTPWTFLLPLFFRHSSKIFNIIKNMYQSVRGLVKIGYLLRQIFSSKTRSKASLYLKPNIYFFIY